MSLTVVGSIAFDRVKTPFGERERLLGGAATHFALAASFFDDVRVVGPVGDDFGEEEYAVLRTRGTNTDDVEHVEGGKTFFWHGEYHFDLNSRTTHDTQLNVFETFDPKLSQASREADVLFLANIQPDLQFQVREQCQAARFVAMDSMNLWIDIARDSLVKTIGSVDAVLLNDGEIKQLTGKASIVAAARELLEWGPRRSSPSRASTARRSHADGLLRPAPPIRSRRGRPDRRGRLVRRRLRRLRRRAPATGDRHDLAARAMAYGTALASYNVEEFGTERVARLTAGEITERVTELQRMTHFHRRTGLLRG
jgi:hypothetical protein